MPARKAHADTGNPKTAPSDESNRIKSPDEWVSGHEPMTGAQASYLKTLSEEAKQPDLYDPDLDKAEASKRIDQLKGESKRTDR
jgi:hypothetical protein